MTQTSDLVFGQGLDHSTDLVFGATNTPAQINGVFSGQFPSLLASVKVIPPAPVLVSGSFAALTMDATLRYDVNVSRPTVATAASPSQGGVLSIAGAAGRSQDAQGLTKGFWAPQTSADPSEITVGSPHSSTLKGETQTSSRDQGAVKAPMGDVKSYHQATIRTSRASSLSRAQQAIRLVNDRRSPLQQAYHGDRRYANSPTKQAIRFGVREHLSTAGVGATHSSMVAQHDQQAMKPMVGVSILPVVPPVGPTPCYTPNANLLFIDQMGTGSALLFQCRKNLSNTTVIVPVRTVYMIANSLSLTRTSDGRVIPCLGATFSIDTDSWTWGFSATIPAGELQYVRKQGSTPVEIAINCNGTDHLFVIDKINRSRSFGKAALSISGRGIAAYLDAPSAPILNFNNAGADRTAQQLMNDVLTLNGVSIGWTVDWNLTDWLVPQGVWSHQGTYISAINAIAQAAGGYVQADRYAKTLRILPRYASKPWEWASAALDYVLPSSVTKTEGIEWVTKPDYNTVFVSGEQAGVLGHITRQGTAGDKPAPMVVDKLITHADAALQRGVSILSDTGDQALVTISLPILPATGIIVPGKFIEYSDGGVPHLGVVRSTSVDAKMPSITQTLGVETHV